MNQRLYVGVDTGGTFTDVVVMDETGAVLTNKAPTTPQALEDGVFAALRLIAGERGESLADMLAQVASFGHGTTQATNALIERRGARTGLITTKGFGDTLLLQRLMGFTAGTPVEQLGEFSRRRYPDPLVPRSRIKEVLERVDQSGSVVIELDESGVRSAVAELVADGVEAYAIALLWAFRNPDHEQRIAAIVRELAGDDVYVSLSSEVNPVLGEYERTSTTVLNSYLGPSVQRYLERMERKLREAGMSGRFSVLNSIGGVMSARDAADKAVLLLASGPTGGVLGSQHLAAQLGHPNVITSDMGGTSFDVGLIVAGRPVVSAVTEVAQYHVAAPMVSITAIGAGGGSIAEVVAGELRVGPESAGAFPGPVCYRRGGARATVTDADVVLGVIDPDTFLGGRMQLDKRAAQEAIATQIAEPLGLSLVEAAAGIRHIVDSRMADTLRELSVGRGLDPRDFVLYAYGGAGPMHCAGFGGDLGVAQIVVPATSMAHSAYGALAADIYHGTERSFLVKTTPGNTSPWEDIDARALDEIYAELGASTRAQLARDGVEPADMIIERSVDVRYRSQTHELIIPVEPGAITAELVRGIVDRFETAYEDTYGKGAGFREAGIELTTFRVSGIGRTPKPAFRDTAPVAAQREHARRVYDVAARDWLDATVVDWHSLQPGRKIRGPAVVEHPTTTVYTGLGQQVGIDTFGNLIITA
ncbi:hydantoinase/oxoprolinase family protein [Gordonia sp. TBRC 11910]|uniref:Hydantoinase/oxoprolinase family protein n=1 Tax=Gordonia asplenii TaxID=2725283 RepID=A0A848KYT8_9ACTN|nr:hydantoinase/oxoprolinase family protein [Gordonia asplenii]NMO02015.1 hydantoinase/oxoprolinase family protein [Gordonia asplenii]